MPARGQGKIQQMVAAQREAWRIEARDKALANYVRIEELLRVAESEQRWNDTFSLRLDLNGAYVAWLATLSVRELLDLPLGSEPICP